MYGGEHADGKRAWLSRWAPRSGTRLLGALLCVAALVVVAVSVGSSAAATKTGGTLTIAVPQTPPSLDPGAGQPAYSHFYNLAYDSLIVQTSDGKFTPGLALSWRYGARNQSFTFKLRPKVKFSDGTSLTAGAVKTWVQHAAKFPGGQGGSYFAALKSIKVNGPLSVTLNFSKPTPGLELVFSQVLQMGLIGSPKAVAAKSLGTSTAGTGAYVLDKGSTVTGDHYTYVPNKSYWNKRSVAWKKVVIRVISNPNAALQALRTGQVQVATDQPTSNLSAARKAGLKFSAPPTLLLGLGLLDRGGKLAKPLRDVRVRQAINYAINRKTVANVVGEGYGKVISQMAAPGDDSYDPALERVYPYDPAKAKKLLAAAGYRNGFTLSVLAWAGVGQDRLAQALAGQLAKVGIDLKLDIKTPVGDYINGMIGAKYPVATLSFGRLPTAQEYALLYGPAANIFNPFKSSSPQLTKLYNRFVVAQGAKSEAIARQMQGYLVRQAWFAPVVATPLAILYRPSVTGLNAAKRTVIYTNEIKPA